MQENLSSREKDIFNLLLEGNSAIKIANKLNITYSTVDFHRVKLYRKLNVSSIQELFINYGRDAGNPENAVSKKKQSISLASAEKPFITHFIDNKPWGWHYYMNPPMNFGKKITKGDIYNFSFKFTSNIDFDLFLVHLLDQNKGKNGFSFIFSHIVLSNIKAYTEYSSSVVMVPEKIASSKKQMANYFKLDAAHYTPSQPTLTFTQFDLIKER